MPPKDLPLRCISWKVLENCNYRCPYCLQPSFKTKYPNDIKKVVETVNSSLNELYEIKIAGGEIFSDIQKAHELTKSIVDYGHWISLCTNLSASEQEYCKFIQETEGKLYTFAASLHLDMTESKVFLNKCKIIRNEMPREAKFQIHNVICPGLENIKRLGKIKEEFEAEGFIFYTDLLVNKVGEYYSYSKDEEILIKKVLGDDEKLFKNKGKSCRSGNTYIALLPNLDAWSCWEGYLKNRREFYLGNMGNGTFELPKRNTICPFDTCSCPTPIIKHKYKLFEN